ncbi:hypothetical protein ACFZB6_31100 [Streptomyces syringium]|uniref:hypothetical protein n=1 Tax=Streptomyces syringium TaxID=76729 RepID=UPI0036EF2489
MNVDDIVRARIETARRKIQHDRQQRTELNAARKAGLAHRHAQKLRNLNQRTHDHNTSDNVVTGGDDHGPHAPRH